MKQIDYLTPSWKSKGKCIYKQYSSLVQVVTYLFPVNFRRGQKGGSVEGQLTGGQRFVEAQTYTHTHTTIQIPA